jgi:microcompartment protein CcmL/EutN
MVKNALGLIEVVGLAAGMEAADAAVKSANVELLGYELTRGGGLVVIKLCGDVGAVKAAVDAGAAAAAKVNKVYGKHVIPRPHNELGGIVITKDTVGQSSNSKPAEPQQPAEQAGEPVVVMEIAEEEKPADNTNEATGSQAAESVEETPVEEVRREPINPAEVCNLCGDPACPRKKGDPRVTCIHYEKNKEDE